MAMEELDEFEVLWPEPETCHTHEPPPPPPSLSPLPVQPAQPSDASAARSRPVDVPGPKAARSWRCSRPRDDSGDHDDDNGSAIVPPHLLLSAGGWRREEEAEAAAWTVRESVGPPCKRARDLRHLRDYVLRMTGFIEG
ncbi:protein S40-6-like [Miscanthus floridulus]|uniref:protein S40-6-like n=1 Tax=Miscanthus floridulus TaxID=154761 RepID=UPI00345A5F41